MDILFDMLLPLYAGSGREKELVALLGGNPSEEELRRERDERKAKGDPLGDLLDDLLE